jgi:hypothetical protein
MGNLKGNDIAEKQNTPEAIQLLKAQRVLYTISKRYGYIDIFIVLLSLTFFMMNIIIKPQEIYFNVFSSVSVLGVIIILFVNKLQKDKTISAAKLQEKFDNEVFGLSQNKILIPTYPSIEIITKYSNGYKKNDLSDWYMAYLIDNFPSSIAVLRCQLVNLIWDKEQRKAFKLLIVSILITSMIGFIAICYVHNYPFQTCMKLLAILSPLVVYLLKNIWGQNEMVENKNNVIDYVLSLLERYKTENYLPTEIELTNIQNNIYIQRTQIQSTISDLWYKIRKKKTEKHLKQVFDNLK